MHNSCVAINCKSCIFSLLDTSLCFICIFKLQFMKDHVQIFTPRNSVVKRTLPKSLCFALPSSCILIQTLFLSHPFVADPEKPCMSTVHSLSQQVIAVQKTLSLQFIKDPVKIFTPNKFGREKNTSKIILVRVAQLKYSRTHIVLTHEREFASSS